jgi:hypothetical protein
MLEPYSYHETCCILAGTLHLQGKLLPATVHVNEVMGEVESGPVPSNSRNAVEDPGSRISPPLMRCESHMGLSV